MTTIVNLTRTIKEGTKIVKQMARLGWMGNGANSAPREASESEGANKLLEGWIAISGLEFQLHITVRFIILAFKPTQRVCHLNIDTQPNHFPTNCSRSRSCTYKKHTILPKQQTRSWCHHKILPLQSAHQRMLRVLPEHNNEPWHLQTSRLSKPAIRPVPPQFRIALTLKKIFMEFAKVEG